MPRPSAIKDLGDQDGQCAWDSAACYAFLALCCHFGWHGLTSSCWKRWNEVGGPLFTCSHSGLQLQPGDHVRCVEHRRRLAVRESLLLDWVSEVMLKLSWLFSNIAKTMRTMRSHSAAVVWHVPALLRSDLLATALDGMLALLVSHVLEAVDVVQFLLLGWESVSMRYLSCEIETYPSSRRMAVCPA